MNMGDIWGVKPDIPEPSETEKLEATFRYIRDKVRKATERGNRPPNIAHAYSLKLEDVTYFLDAEYPKASDFQQEWVIQKARDMGYKNETE